MALSSYKRQPRTGIRRVGDMINDPAGLVTSDQAGAIAADPYAPPAPPVYQRMAEPERPELDDRRQQILRRMALGGAIASGIGALANLPALAVAGASFARPAADQIGRNVQRHEQLLDTYYDQLQRRDEYNLGLSNREAADRFELDRDLYTQRIEDRRAEREQAFKKQLQEDLQAHQIELEEIRAANDRTLEELRQKDPSKLASAAESRARASYYERGLGAGLGTSSAAKEKIDPAAGQIILSDIDTELQDLARRRAALEQIMAGMSPNLPAYKVLAGQLKVVTDRESELADARRTVMGKMKGSDIVGGQDKSDHTRAPSIFDEIGW